MSPDLYCGLGMGWIFSYLEIMACVVIVWEVIQEEGKGVKCWFGCQGLDW